MSSLKEYIWNGSKYVEVDAGTVDGKDSLEFETADPAIQAHIKSPHASVEILNSSKTAIDEIKNGGYIKSTEGVEFEHVNNTIDAKLLGGKPPEHYAVKSEVDLAIGQLQSDIGNIDVSWDGITGKPATFTPAAHGHDGFIARSGDGSAVYLNGVDLDNVVITGLYRGTGCSNQPSLTAGWFYMTVISHGSTWVYQELVDLHNSNRKFIRHRYEGVWSAWTDPFGIVVNGKQAVVNAINGSLGYASGLTTSHTHADYAWWIQNKVNTVKDVGFERMMRMYAAGHFSATGTSPAIPYSKNITVGSTLAFTNSKGNQYYSSTITLPSAGTYLLINSIETVRADTSGHLTSVGSMTQIAAYSYYYMSGKYYYGSLFKVTNPGIFYNSAGYSGMSSYPRIDAVIELTPQSLQWLAGTIN